MSPVHNGLSAGLRLEPFEVPCYQMLVANLRFRYGFNFSNGNGIQRSVTSPAVRHDKNHVGIRVGSSIIFRRRFFLTPNTCPDYPGSLSGFKAFHL